MNKISKKNYQLPLPTKLTVVGSRVATSVQPNYLISKGQLIVSDSWVIQLVYTTEPNNRQPQLLEFPITWDDSSPWGSEEPINLIICYKRSPQIQLMHSSAPAHARPFLNITVEVPLSIEPIQLPGPAPQLAPSAVAVAAEKPPVEKNTSKSAEPEPSPEQPATAELQQRFEQLEERYRELAQTVKELTQRVCLLENRERRDNPSTAKFAGYVVDSFRLVPIPKAILELYNSGSEEPAYKVAANNQGFFIQEDILPGTYDIKVRHPRYQTLDMKNYLISAGENKCQDFLLKRL